MRERRVEIDFAEGCLTGEVVTAGPQRHSATRNKQGFEIQDQRSTNAAASLRFVDNDWVQLPHEAFVFPNGADPAEDDAIVSNSRRG